MKKLVFIVVILSVILGGCSLQNKSVNSSNNPLTSNNLSSSNSFDTSSDDWVRFDYENVVDNNKKVVYDINKLSTYKENDEFFCSASVLSSRGGYETIEDVNEKLGVQYLRKVDKMYYSINPLLINNEIAYLFVIYQVNNEDLMIIDKFCLSLLIKDTAFENVEINETTFSEIKEIDNAALIFTNYSDDGYTSYHKLSSGDYAEIGYVQDNGKYTVKSINYMPVSYELSKQFFKNILEKDYALIK